MSLLTILKAMGLEMLLLPLEELRVETPDDLQLLEEDAIQELKGNYIQKKKLKVLIEQHKSSGQEVNNNKLLVDLAKKLRFPTEDMQVSYSNITPKSRSNQIKVGRRPEHELPTKKSKILFPQEKEITSQAGNSIQRQCKIVNKTHGFTVYHPKMRVVYSTTNFQKKVFGSPNKQFQEKVILLIGATGSGKTTLINMIVNYLFSVQYNDPFRYKLILDREDGSGKQTESQTRSITAYTLYYQNTFPLPFNLTIIDTPGFGDTRGIKRDLEITEQIKNFFSTPGDKGIDHIDVVGFVTISSLARLTPTQQYIFDSILSLFGRDIEENIFLLLTFADGKSPQALEAMNVFGIPTNSWFKFNNSVLFEFPIKSETLSDDDDGNFDKMFWKMGTKSCKDFLSKLTTVLPKSLFMTKSVLEMRNKIQLTIQKLQEEVTTGLNKLEQLKEEVNIVLKHKSTIEQNKDFEYTVIEEVIKSEKISPGTYITNCVKCNTTCHYPCRYSNNWDKIQCLAITNQYCNVCDKKCHWSDHVNNDFRIITIQEKKVKDSMYLKQKYQKAQGEYTSAEGIVTGLLDEIRARQLKIVGLTSEMRTRLEELDKIALKPNPLSTLDYIDILIDAEENTARAGWKERKNQLEDIRKEVVVMNTALNRGEDPFEEYKMKIAEERESQDEGVWATVGHYLDNIGFFSIFY